MPRPPSIQWYYKQYLGDNDVLAMEWDASGMHAWLLNLSIQEIPPGSLPNDMTVIRRWLRNPSDDVWRRVQPQIFAAWKLRDGRWFNSGMEQTFERRENYKHRYETGTRITSKVAKDEEVVREVVIEDLKPKPEEDFFDVQQATTYVFLELGLAGNEARMLANDAVKAYIHRHKCTPRDAAEGLVALKVRYDAEVTEFRCGVINWLKAGVWKDPEKWQKTNGQTQLTKTEERVVSNARAAAASLGMGYSGHKNGDASRPTETPTGDGRRLQTLAGRVSGKIPSGD